LKGEKKVEGVIEVSNQDTTLQFSQFMGSSLDQLRSQAHKDSAHPKLNIPPPQKKFRFAFI